MTDTTSPRPTPASGLTIARVNTSDGIHPYDAVSWERRDVVQTNWKTGEVIFEQRSVEFPEFWSVNASTIVTTKYFRGANGSDSRETSLKQLIDRVVNTYETAGIDHGYFATVDDARIFADELRWMLLHQVFSFNSPVWFNVGTTSPQQVSACFILSVDDTMQSILNWYTEEGLIFKGGSGAGLNLSRLRSSKETLKSSGGTASGPVSFMRGADASAGTIKSGGACLAPWTLVYTERGPVAVSDLAAAGEDFITLGYNPQARRVQANRSQAFLSGRKNLVRLITDKGEFTMSEDHPVMLMGGGYAAVGDLTSGMSVRPGNITVSELGYQRVGMHDGHKSKESVHRLVALDIMGMIIKDMEVHHKDRNPKNNHPSNLELLSRVEHLREHASEDVAAGVHPFQRFHGPGQHPAVAGDANGMSFASGNRTEAYARNREAGMQRRGVYRVGQEAAARQRMLNKAYAVVNSGGSIDTFEEYFSGRCSLAGKMGYSKAKQLEKIASRFGSYDAFRDEVRAGNHRVIAVEPLCESDVYDVQVFNDTPDDRSDRDGHNFLIISETNSQKGFTGIYVHNTRRAAKMVVLDVDHPDIEEFIDTKATEERKIRVLRDAGFDMDLGGKDIASVQYQNANNSVRVSDLFMHAVENNEPFGLISRTTGEVIETVDAASLFAKIAQAAWECADPGIQYDDTINDWHTNPVTGRITASNPCSEFLSLDNSSCNLASLNLLAFLDEDGNFEGNRFRQAVELIITAMDISICFADFPTEPIGRTTRDYRQLGIGYSNLGALLMSIGVPYDSEEGRAMASVITALMTGAAYRRSAELAGVVGPYAGYAANKEPHLNVMLKHQRALENVETFNLRDSGLLALAEEEWAAGNDLGRVNGWRNAQASVLAPTGTISFMMDCDTTGVEPDFALLKFKKLVGGGSMQIVNAQVPRALASLGYQNETIEAIEAHIVEHGHVENAPGLRPEHYAVFDCAVGDRAISPDGHILMMAAVQPFVSGAISKTVNLPETATVEDIERVYLDAWKLGLKAVAVYRDNCKVGQPLSSAKPAASEEATAAPTAVEREIVYVEVPTRTRLPRTRGGQTVSFEVQGNEGYLTTGVYEDGRLGEVFVKMSKQGSTLAGLIDAFSIAVSIGLQYGVPLETYIEKFIGTRFEPAGVTDDPDIRMAQSVVDYIFRRLALDYLDTETRSAFGILSASERIAALDTKYEPAKADPVKAEAVKAEAVKAVEPPGVPTDDDVPAKEPKGFRMEAPICSNCGHNRDMRPSGSCWACACGTTTGCS